MSQIEAKKGELIQRSGDLNSKVCFVYDGTLRGYTLDKKGREHIFILVPKHWIIADNQ